MLTSIVLDILLVLIVLMMIPLGLLRGGLREVCTTAALLLGILMAGEWAERWSGGLKRAFDMGEGSSQFAMAVLIVVGITGLAGYGGSAAFSWRPGPGGRMYGAYLSLLNAIIFIGYLINVYVATIFDGQIPETIENTWIARAVSVGFEWVLLIGTIGILGATLFGMVVRERGDSESVDLRPTAEDLYHVRYEPPRPQVRPLNDPETTIETPAVPSKPVRIREVRHWEESPQSTLPDSSYGSGWRKTWPEDRDAMPHTYQPGASSPSRPTAADQGRQHSGSQKDVLRDWMRSDKDRHGQD